MKHRAVTAPDSAATTKIAELSQVTIDSLIQMNLLHVHLQPIVDIRTGEIYAQEALARCHIQEMASPLRLLATAVEQGAIGRLGRHLRARAVHAAGGARLFLNVHPDELDEEHLCSDDDPIFHYDGRVVLEVPESAPLVRYRYAHSTLQLLRGRGMRVALDDFGAGYSNLGYIATLAPEYVKIDRELIAGVEPGSRQQRLLTSLNALCVAQGARVIAEGIETQNELTAVLEAGIPFAQGYFLGRPSPTGAAIWKPS
jgi:EAL domain-containing protein (putative c-di-GMP-specific phosphodiesterase class I)